MTGQFLRVVQVWQQITGRSTLGKMFGAATIIALVTLFVKALAVGKEFAVAWQLGTGDSIDAFLIAFLIPSFLINVVANSLNAALIPTYIQVREQQGPGAAGRLLAGSMVVSLGVLSLVMVMVAGLAPFYLPKLAPGFGPEKLQLTLQLLRVMVPLIAISGLSVLWGAVLNAGERFALVALAPSLTSITIVGLLLAWPRLQGFALALGLLVGAVLELGLIGWSLGRRRLAVLPRWTGWSPELRQVVGQFLPVMAGACVFSSSELIDQSMASHLPAGSVAALGYGNKMISLPMTLLSTAIGTAVMPYFAQLVAQGRWGEIRQLLWRMLPWMFLTCSGLAAGLAIFAVPIVRLLFEHGAFGPEDTILVARVQAGFALQIPFHICAIVIVRLLSAMKENQVVFYGSFISITLNFLMNLLFMHWFGVSGIALSTSCVYIMSAIYLLWSWRRISQRYSHDDESK
jgi:putative peptidoglycan lipid II flippase